MTALANLSALATEMRELAQTSDDCQYGTISTDTVRKWADRIAALSPAELGGVEEYVDPLDVFLSQGVDDVPCLQVPGRVLVRFIPGSWDHAYELFSGNTPTPRAAEGVTDELIETFCLAAEQAAGMDEGCYERLPVGEGLRAVFAALTPPSAKGE